MSHILEKPPSFFIVSEFLTLKFDHQVKWKFISNQVGSFFNLFKNLTFELLQLELNIHLAFTLPGITRDIEMKVAILLPSF